MKKIILSTALATSCMFAVDIKPFIGLDYAKVDTSIETKEVFEGDREKYNFDLDDNSLIFKAGAILDEKHRIYFSYAKTTFTEQGDDIDYTLPAVNYDYLFNYMGFTPYIGAHIGYGTTGLEEISPDFTGAETGRENIDNSNVNYGFQFGVLKDITDNISLELGYKLTFIDSEFYGYNEPDGLGGTNTVTTTHEDNRALYFGINYKF